MFSFGDWIRSFQILIFALKPQQNVNSSSFQLDTVLLFKYLGQLQYLILYLIILGHLIIQLWIKYTNIMNSFLTKLIANRGFQDTAAMVRGVWRIVDAATKNNEMQVYNHSKNKNQSLPNSNVTKPLLEKEKEISKVELNSETNRQNISLKSEQQKHINQSLSKEPNVTKPAATIPKAQKNYKQKLQQFKQAHSADLNLQPVVNFKQAPVAKKLPKTSTSRAFEFSKLGVNLAGSAFSSFIQKKLGIKDKDAPTILTPDNAKMITDTLCKMRGAPLKLAQALSIQEDKLIPKEIREAFERARDQAYIIPDEEVQYMMFKSFGPHYKQKYFKQFDEKPFAASSIGQVHSAYLKNGKKVAIKIQYPNIKQAIDSDLQNVKVFLGYTGILPATLFLDKIISNTRIQLMEQCDYILEAEKQKKYKQNLKYQDKYYVPQVIEELSSDDILTCQFIDGISMNGLEKFPQEIRNQIGQRIMSLTFYQLFIYNFMQTDPNPSNFFYDIIHDKLNLIDFGAARSYDQNFIDYYWQVIKGAVEQNDDLIWKASIKMGFVTGQQNHAMKKAHIQSIKIVGEPWKFKGTFDFGNENLTQRIYKTMPVMLKNRLKPPPPQVYSLHRKLSGSYLLCIRLKAKVDTNKIFQEIKSVYRINSENILQ